MVTDRHFLIPKPFCQKVQSEHLRVIEVVNNFGVSICCERERPITGLSIGNSLTRYKLEYSSQNMVTKTTMGSHVIDAAQEAAPNDVVRVSIQNRFNDVSEFFRGVFTVGITKNNRCSLAFNTDSQTHTHRCSETLILTELNYFGSAFLGTCDG